MLPLGHQASSASIHRYRQVSPSVHGSVLNGNRKFDNNDLSSIMKGGEQKEGRSPAVLHTVVASSTVYRPKQSMTLPKVTAGTLQFSKEPPKEEFKHAVVRKGHTRNFAEDEGIIHPAAMLPASFHLQSATSIKALPVRQITQRKQTQNPSLMYRINESSASKPVQS